MQTRAFFALPVALFLAACGTSAGTTSAPEPVSTPSGRTPLGSVAPPPSASAPAPVVAAPTAFANMVRSLSEPDGPFISDNIISNETSYLQVAPALAKAAVPGGAYIGVGPEQNFTYIALTRPRLAFILDIRRQNMIEHLLYKAAFIEATSRAHFLALLVARPYQAEGDPGPEASIDAVMAHAEKLAADEATFTATHARLRAVIEKDMPLDAEDKKTLEVTHRAFFKGQLDVRFSLKASSGRRYPTLRELLDEKDPEGVKRGFLASEESFRFVQMMEREGRILPVVGDFAGDRALSGIAAQIVKEKLAVSTFYVSNVEQYLFEPKVWPKWARNVATLPTHDKSIFIRAYLDQGKKHPQQMKGHRTATILQRITDFNEHQAKRAYATWWEVASEPWSLSQ
ncbi:Hypothetical protein A7982_11895 [Minicystis rosea]|nr:Hypothetical protein A7982_11895 [Minicystis rosea]